MKNLLKKISFPLFLMAPFAFLCALALVSNAVTMAFADSVPSISDSLIALFGAIQGHATSAVVLALVFQVLRTNEVIGILGKIGLHGKPLQVTIAVVTALGYVFNAYAKGENLLQAAIEGLFTAGGAMLIYDAVAGVNASPGDPAAPVPAAPAPVAAASVQGK